MKTCLILGGAECVWHDAERATELSEFNAAIAVKRMAEVWNGPLYAFATLHPSTARDSIRIRRARGLPTDFITCSNKKFKDVIDYVTPDWSGSSGLFAVKVALERGFTRIVLAGVPMDAQQHFIRKVDWKEFESYHKGWRLHYQTIAPYVRSMSGWTRQLLGEPTEDWLQS